MDEEMLILEDTIMFLSNKFKTKHMLINIPSINNFNINNFNLDNKTVINFLSTKISKDKQLLANYSNNNIFRELLNNKFIYNVLESMLLHGNNNYDEDFINLVVELFNDGFSSLNKQNDILKNLYPQFFEFDIDGFDNSLDLYLLETNYFNKFQNYIGNVLHDNGFNLSGDIFSTLNNHQHVWFNGNSSEYLHKCLEIPTVFLIKSINIKHKFIEVLVFHH